MKNHHRLKQAFVATVGATVIAAGCSIESTFHPIDTHVEAVCPSSEPAAGSNCPEADLFCSYSDGDCPVEYECDGSSWSRTVVSCNPPPPPSDCPASLPEGGAECPFEPWGYPEGCSYSVETPCGEEQAGASCVSDGSGGVVWEIDPVSCQAPPESCGDYAHPDLCASDAGCQWLVPGCAEGEAAPPAVEGCYRAGDCLQTGCGEWGACDTVTHDPCWNDFCDACGGEINVCVPVAEG